jgi:Chaperone of endosialidase
MAGNARFHDKLHRKNHHTNPTTGYLDSAIDPIASRDEPFQGDFFLNGALSSNSLITASAENILGNLSCYNAYVRDITYTDFISGRNTQTIFSDRYIGGSGDNSLTVDFLSGIYLNSKTISISADRIAMGTQAPSATLHISCSTTLPAIKITQLANFTNSHAFYVEDQSNDSTPTVIDYQGHMGIGTKIPNVELSVIGSISATSNVTVGSLAGTGSRAVNADSSGTLIIASSDGILKENVSSISQGLNEVLQLNPVSFNWKDTEKYGSHREIGFIAQEVKPIIPEIVGISNDGILSLDYAKVVAVLTKAIQELNEISKLKTKKTKTVNS